MNLPNKLTVLRILMIPFFVFFLKFPSENGHYIALAIFVLASLTDTADGYIARKYHLVTDFGKFMDPLADKLLVSSAMICLISRGDMPDWAVLIIIAREFIISGFRLVAADNGVVIAAGIWGKVKTVVQMIMIIVILLELPALRSLETVLIYAAVALTIISLCDYMVKNRQVLGKQK